MISAIFTLGILAELWWPPLVRASLGGGVFILLVWVICRALPKLPARGRFALWGLACLRLLVGLAWVQPVSVSVLPSAKPAPLPLTAPYQSFPLVLSELDRPAASATPTISTLAVGKNRTPTTSKSDPVFPQDDHRSSSQDEAAPFPSLTLFLTLLTLKGSLILLWFGGMALLAFRLILQCQRLRRCLSQASPVNEEALLSLSEELSQALHLKRLPPLLHSPSITGPMVVGTLRPKVLLPSDLEKKHSSAELRMILAHEFAHLRRKDLWAAWLPALTSLLFFFHPLAWLARREMLLASEVACDTHALEATGAAPQDYGRVLLQFSLPVSEPSTPLAMGVTTGYLALKRRLLMLDSLSLPKRRRLGIGIAVLVGLLMIGMIPFRLAAKGSIRKDPHVERCTDNLRQIGSALARYKLDNHTLPATLSELYPDNLNDLATFRCPADDDKRFPFTSSTPGEKHPTSYIYALSLTKTSSPFFQLGSPQMKKTWRAQKQVQLTWFGDLVPVVRCPVHLQWLNLTRTGRIYESQQNWETDPITVPEVLKNMNRDLSAGAPTFLSRWSIFPLKEYFRIVSMPGPEIIKTEVLQGQLRAVAVRLAALVPSLDLLSKPDAHTLISLLDHDAGKEKDAQNQARLSLAARAEAFKSVLPVSRPFSESERGEIVTVAGRATYGFSGDGGPALNAYFYYMNTLAVADDGSLLIGDLNNDRVRMERPDGLLLAVAGFNNAEVGPSSGEETGDKEGKLAIREQLSPTGIVLDAAGNLYLSDDQTNTVRKVNPEGRIETVAGQGYTIVQKPGEGSPHLRIGGYSGDGRPALKAMFNHPQGLAVDSKGNLYIADSNNHVVRKVDPDGAIHTVAGLAPIIHDPLKPAWGGYSGDGGPATNARLSHPTAVAVDAGGNLFIVDEGNNRIRKVSPDGIISTVAGSGTEKEQIIGQHGRLAGASFGDGGPATNARLDHPNAIAVDSAGQLFIGDGMSRVRRVDTKGIITTVAGKGVPGYAGDGGSATQAALNGVMALVIDRYGNLFIGDGLNYVVRRVAGVAAPGLLGGKPYPSQPSQAAYRMAEVAIRYAPVKNAYDYYVKADEKFREKLPRIALEYIQKGLTGPLHLPAKDHPYSLLQSVTNEGASYAQKLARHHDQEEALAVLGLLRKVADQARDTIGDKETARAVVGLLKTLMLADLLVRKTVGEPEAERVWARVNAEHLELFEGLVLKSESGRGGMVAGFSNAESDLEKTRWDDCLYNFPLETELKNIFMNLPQNKEKGRQFFNTASNRDMGFEIDPSLRKNMIPYLVIPKEHPIPFMEYLQLIAHSANRRLIDLSGDYKAVLPATPAQVYFKEGVYHFVPENASPDAGI